MLVSTDSPFGAFNTALRHGSAPRGFRLPVMRLPVRGFNDCLWPHQAHQVYNAWATGVCFLAAPNSPFATYAHACS